MFATRPTPLRAAWIAERAFAVGRARTLKRLLLCGIPEGKAKAWVDAWDVTTAGLVDFRRAPDFWQLGFEYALEESRLGYEPPLLPAAGQRPVELGAPDEQAHTG